MAHSIEHVFQPRLVAVGAVAEIDEDADDRIRHLGGIRGLDDDVGIFRKIPVTGNTADAKAKPNSGLDAKTIPDLYRREGDVVGLLHHGDLAGAVEGDVELARQAIKRSIVEDVVVPLPRILAGVQNFLRIDPGGGRARHIADVVGAGTARAQAELLYAFDRATVFFGGISRTCKLARVVTWQNGPHSFSTRSARPANCECFRIRSESASGTGRNAAPAPHKTGRDAPAEIVGRRRRCIVERLLL